MKAYKIELVVVDHENYGESKILGMLENVKYINPLVTSIEKRDIGEWSDAHPLNKDYKEYVKDHRYTWTRTEVALNPPDHMKRERFAVDITTWDDEDERIFAAFYYLDSKGRWMDVYYDDALKLEHYSFDQEGEMYFDADDQYWEDLHLYVIPDKLRASCENLYETNFEHVRDAVEYFKSLGFGEVSIQKEWD